MGRRAGARSARLQGAVLTLHVIRWTDAPEVPWRNGGGLTRELLVVGADPFDWRLSAATIASDGPFSSFPCIDRILVLLRGDGVCLRFGDDQSTVLDRPGAACAFAGERPVDAALLGGPTVDLNLMWNRDRYSAVLLDPPASGAADVTVVHVAAGAASTRMAGEPGLVRLGPGDSAWWVRNDGVEMVPDEASTVIRFALTAR